MATTAITLSFSVERQMEIAEIVIDCDQAAALELVKTLQRELRTREQGTCGSIFHAPADDNPAASGSDAHTTNHG
ncbi:MAG: hypothetical protein NTV79_08135 [Candidatus Aureabacteria bacterium]|nr:hypothetical protein [Candidatus Auribacterota bacterium]